MLKIYHKNLLCLVIIREVFSIHEVNDVIPILKFYS